MQSRFVIFFSKDYYWGEIFMKPLRDPEKAELNHILAICDISGKTVLEIGCGDGFLTKQYSQKTGKIVGIDPLASELKIASKKARYINSFYLQGKAENLPFADQFFDTTLFASSLWWIEAEGMVHALKESWRVLAIGGIMIDVRPLSVPVPLEIVHAGGMDVAGTADLSPGLEYDLAADRSIETVLVEGLFSQSTSQNFDYVYYWNTFHGMLVDFKERWEGEIILSNDVFENARLLYRQKRPSARMRLPMRMKIAKYIKLG